MRDLRLYYYNSGQLMKWNNSKGGYKFSTMEDIKGFIERMNAKLTYKYQWVITEYFDNYNSKIIEITNGYE